MFYQFVLSTMVRTRGTKIRLDRHHHTQYGDDNETVYQEDLDRSFDPELDRESSGSDVSSYRSSESDRPNEPVSSKGWRHVA